MTAVPQHWPKSMLLSGRHSIPASLASSLLRGWATRLLLQIVSGYILTLSRCQNVHSTQPGRRRLAPYDAVHNLPSPATATVSESQRSPELLESGRGGRGFGGPRCRAYVSS
ncbi:hypothetical protein EXIGLDRAFT_384071 [Exidia glandulosa HHB12029]|uniref:Uncharacterized protein n=1 Tax=Exidia glandulosa HHB12029 TaxID=1314781 RepID=A0A165BFU1_EXIGL|nr:hypothetical protein EXIGLDRAFT_412036 [Exidia glandulosa HHB12029]KZV97320.1 hypothetical protein EXIGLDRAFT_384071 [Exidia glandulosa HHB12029]